MDPRLTICLLTYARTDYAIKTLESTLKNLVWTGELRVHIADDGSDETHRSKLFYTAQNFVDHKYISISNAERGGYGRNVNLATQVIHTLSDYVLMLEDDWELVQKLDIDKLIEDMEDDERLRCIRLGYLSFTQRLMADVIQSKHYKYLLLYPASPEPHVFAGHPRLERVSYQRQIGAWPENLLPGQTEFAVAHMSDARCGVAWPLDVVRTWGDVFAHIGTERSY